MQHIHSEIQWYTCLFFSTRLACIHTCKVGNCRGIWPSAICSQCDDSEAVVAPREKLRDCGWVCGCGVNKCAVGVLHIIRVVRFALRLHPHQGHWICGDFWRSQRGYRIRFCWNAAERQNRCQIWTKQYKQQWPWYDKRHPSGSSWREILSRWMSESDFFMHQPNKSEFTWEILCK